MDAVSQGAVLVETIEPSEHREIVLPFLYSRKWDDNAAEVRKGA